MLAEYEKNEIKMRAVELLPKYGGFVSGAVNQASILLGYAPSVEEFKEIEATVQEAQDWIDKVVNEIETNPTLPERFHSDYDPEGEEL